MVLQVTNVPCTNGGYNYIFVSGVDHLGFKFDRTTNEYDTYTAIFGAPVSYYRSLRTAPTLLGMG